MPMHDEHTSPMAQLRSRLERAGADYSCFDSDDGLVLKTVWHTWDPALGELRTFEATWTSRDAGRLFVTASNLSVDEAMQASVSAERAHLVRTDYGSWPHDLKCSRCGVVYPYFTWYDSTGLSRHLRVRRCPSCDRLIAADYDS